MKPALLYLKKYIDQNYKEIHLQQSLRKRAIEKQEKINLEEGIFKEKKRYDCNNQNQKQLYFKVPKSLNIQRKKKKLAIEERKTNSTEGGIATIFLKSQQLNQPKQKKTFFDDTYVREVEIVKKVIPQKKLNIDDEGKQHQQKNNTQIQVKFKIIPPERPSDLPSDFQQKMPLKYSQQDKARQEDKSRILTQGKIEQRNEELIQVPDKLDCSKENQTNQSKSAHSRKVCNSMKKESYNSLFDYLAEMKRFKSVAKKQIKEAHYYPLAHITPKAETIKLQQLKVNKQKAFLRNKLQQYSKLIQVQQNFSIEAIEINSLSQIMKQKKQRQDLNKVSQLKNNYEQTSQSFAKKQKRLLLQYDQIVICNCSNKRFFKYEFSKNSDYNSFLKFTTPVLQMALDQENNEMIVKKKTESCGLYFCCLINITLGQKECFFWIGKPLQYYRKALVIKIIDDFLFEVKFFHALKREKVSVVDVYGRNSFISKNLLTKCNQNNFMSKSQKEKARKSKKISASQQWPNSVMTQSFLNLIKTSSDFGESFCLKKERNNINTRGTFKMIYN